MLVNSNVYSIGGCPFGQDEVWNITWPATNSSTIARQKCPGSSEAEGKTVKHLLFFYYLFIWCFFLVTVGHSFLFL